MLGQTSQSQIITIPTRKRERRRLLRECPGLLSAVARRHRVKVSHVCKVYHGQVVSARVRNAILAELQRRMEAELEGKLAHAS